MQASYDNARLESKTGTAPAGKLNDINVALLGAGDEGEVLLNSKLKIPGLRFRAICDIWTGHNPKKLVNRLKRYNFDAQDFEISGAEAQR
jgi:predicted homoserine dehydrogenase-like protein